jgi:hypothetical protein
MLFGLFLRSREMREFDHALRAVGLHPMLVPEAVKLTTVKLLKESSTGVTPQSRAAAAELLGYCRQGPEAFAQTNGAARTHAVERRIEAALEAGDSLDARLVLLALHARMIDSGVVDRYGLEVG